MKTTWGDLEVGMSIATPTGTAGWKVADLTPTHITVADEEDGSLSTFARKDPWVEIDVVLPTAEHVAAFFGGHLIEEEVDGVVSYHAWPDDPDFIVAAQSHLARQHHVEPGERTYDELRQLHVELHEAGDADHVHLE